MNEHNRPLFDKMLNHPLDFTAADFEALIQTYKLPNNKYDVQAAFADFRACMKHVYNLNETRLQETSHANTGLLGTLNKLSTYCRRRKYFGRVEKQKPHKKYVRIYAEGDSWFLFPVFVKDIIHFLGKNKNYFIYSDAFAGDWLTNIIYEGQYIEALTIHAPDVFLISGGGNDLVGNERLAVMVSNKPNQKPKHSVQTLAHISDENQRQLLLGAQPYITKEFYAFLWIIKAQYTILFKGLYENTDKFKDMISITHGYAYPYPKKGIRFSWRYPLQPLANYLVGSGKWLYRPLMIRGILDPKLQRAITMTFIYEYNEMLISLCNQFANVYHIDCREMVQKEDDWYDELHLKTHKYKEIADRFMRLINAKFS